MKGGQCGSLMGGKRRGSRGSRRMRGGAAGVGPAITVGTLENTYVDTATPVDPVTLAAKPDIYDIPQRGARRRSRKTAKKGRKGRKGTRKMRGGASQISMGTVGYGYGGGGTVTSGPPDATQYTQRGNPF
jgi:hypothetical protein